MQHVKSRIKRHTTMAQNFMDSSDDPETKFDIDSSDARIDWNDCFGVRTAFLYIGECVDLKNVDKFGLLDPQFVLSHGENIIKSQTLVDAGCNVDFKTVIQVPLSHRFVNVVMSDWNKRADSHIGDFSINIQQLVIDKLMKTLDINHALDLHQGLIPLGQDEKPSDIPLNMGLPSFNNGPVVRSRRGHHENSEHLTKHPQACEVIPIDSLQAKRIIHGRRVKYKKVLLDSNWQVSCRVLDKRGQHAGSVDVAMYLSATPYIKLAMYINPGTYRTMRFLKSEAYLRELWNKLEEEHYIKREHLQHYELIPLYNASENSFSGMPTVKVTSERYSFSEGSEGGFDTKMKNYDTYQIVPSGYTNKQASIFNLESQCTVEEVVQAVMNKPQPKPTQHNGTGEKWKEILNQVRTSAPRDNGQTSSMNGDRPRWYSRFKRASLVRSGCFSNRYQRSSEDEHEPLPFSLETPIDNDTRGIKNETASKQAFRLVQGDHTQQGKMYAVQQQMSMEGVANSMEENFYADKRKSISIIFSKKRLNNTPPK